jgi:hypothetical protein
MKYFFFFRGSGPDRLHVRNIVTCVAFADGLLPFTGIYLLLFLGLYLKIRTCVLQQVSFSTSKADDKLPF